MAKSEATDLAELLGLIVHDLRNPAATLGANVSFVKEVTLESSADEDLQEAIQDIEAALADLRRGLDQLGWIGRWIGAEQALPVADGDVVTALEKAAGQVSGVEAQVSAAERPLRARGGGTLARLMELLLLNSRQHAKAEEVKLSAWREGDEVVAELRDAGPAVSPEWREAAFTMAGQTRIKGRADGRYSRAAGLLAARVLADAIGARIEAGGESGEAWFRVHLPAM